MELEVRRVPPEFEHPSEEIDNSARTTRRVFVPCFDETFGEAAAKYDRARQSWEAGTHPDQKRHATTPASYEEWAGEPPWPECHLPDSFDRDGATAWCLHENTTEGTPVTPMFAAREELVAHPVARWRRSMGTDVAGSGRGGGLQRRGIGKRGRRRMARSDSDRRTRSRRTLTIRATARAGR